VSGGSGRAGDGAGASGNGDGGSLLEASDRPAADARLPPSTGQERQQVTTGGRELTEILGLMNSRLERLEQCIETLMNHTMLPAGPPTTAQADA